MTHPRTPTLLLWLGQAQTRWPWHFLLLAAVSLLPALWGIFARGGLGFRPEFSELLPDNKPSVIEMRRVSARLPGASTLTVVAEVADGKRRDALKRFAERLVPKLLALGPSQVGAVDYGSSGTRTFFEKHALLFADLVDLEQARDDVVERYDYEIAKRAGTLLEEDEPPPPLSADSIEQRLRGAERRALDGAHPAAAAARDAARSPAAASGAGSAGAAPSTLAPPPASNADDSDGYYINAEGTLLAVLIRTPVSGSRDKLALRERVAKVVAALNPTSFDPTLRVSYTGNVITGQEEYDAIVGDLRHVGGWGLVGVLGSVFTFFLRLRTVAALAVTIAVALVWTFGVTRATIGYLNSSTGFLVSIIAGNGINYGIMYMARYIEARRDEGSDVARAIECAHRDSWLPTLAGSTTAMLAYGSLTLTNFRGFKHFGIISGYGMLLCWLATYTLLPALLVASERVLPAFRGGPGERARLGGWYALGFAWLARWAPRSVVLAAAAAGCLSLYATARYLQTDPMEYDMRNVRNERRDPSSAAVLGSRVDAVVGRLGQDGMAIMTDRLDQVPMLEAALRERWTAAPATEKPFDRVVSIYSLLPTAQEQKLPVIEELCDRLERARRRGFIADADWSRLEPHLPEGKPRPLSIADLPEQIARPFTERDGTRGRILYIVPTTGFSVWNAHYLMRWADSYRQTRLPTGEVIYGSGAAVIYADMIRTIGEDTPKAIAGSALGSIVVLLLALGLRRRAWGVFLPWLLGIAGLFAYLHLSSTKLNFLNFVAIPITIGIGAEYAHNMVQRYRVEGPAQIHSVTVNTGGAVILCSLTTMIGYLALTLSFNRGIRSFGAAAAVGEITCVLAAVLALPAALHWAAARSRASAEPSVDAALAASLADGPSQPGS